MGLPFRWLAWHRWARGYVLGWRRVHGGGGAGLDEAAPREPTAQARGHGIPRHDGEHPFEDEGERRHEDRPAGHLGVVAHREPVEQVAAEAAEAHGRGDGGGRDDLQGGGAQPREDERHGARQLDTTQHLTRAHPHPVCRVAGSRVDRLDPRVGARQQGWDAEQEQHDDARDDEGQVAREVGADDHLDREEQPEARHRAGDVADRDHPAASSGVPDPQAGGQRDRGGEGEGERGVPQVLEDAGRDAAGAGPVRRVGEPAQDVVQHGALTVPPAAMG